MTDTRRALLAAARMMARQLEELDGRESSLVDQMSDWSQGRLADWIQKHRGDG